MHFELVIRKPTYSTYDVLEYVIVVTDVSGVIAKVRVETSPCRCIGWFVETQVPFANSSSRVPQFSEVFRQQFLGQWQTVRFGTISRRTLHTCSSFLSLLLLHFISSYHLLVRTVVKSNMYIGVDI